VFAEKKEPHFFSYGYTGLARDYERNFRRKWDLRLRWDLDASVCYLFHPAAPKRISSIYPNANLIALLRDPADRAVSQYFHNLRKGRESNPFSKAIELELARGLEYGVQDYDNPNGVTRHFSYLARGMYEQQLRRFQNYFASSQVHVIASEEYFSNPQQILREISERIGVSVSGIENRHRNRGNNKSNNSVAMANEIRPLFTAKNRELELFLGRTMPWT
jgi:hypothetical protein